LLYSENQTEFLNTLCRQDAELLNVKSAYINGTCYKQFSILLSEELRCFRNKVLTRCLEQRERNLQYTGDSYTRRSIIICTRHEILRWSYKWRLNGETCSTYGGDEKFTQRFSRKSFMDFIVTGPASQTYNNNNLKHFSWEFNSFFSHNEVPFKRGIRKNFWNYIVYISMIPSQFHPPPFANYMEQNPWEFSSHSASQGNRCFMWNRKVHWRVHRNPSLIPLLSQMNPFHTSPPYFSKVTCIKFASTLRSLNWSLPFKLSEQNVVCISHLAHVCYIPHPSFPSPRLAHLMYSPCICPLSSWLKQLFMHGWEEHSKSIRSHWLLGT